MLKQRIITALVLIPFVVFAIFFASIQLFSVIAAAILGIAAYEWAGLMGIRARMTKYAYVTLVLLAMLVVSISESLLVTWPSLAWPRQILFELPYVLLLAGGIFWALTIVLVSTYPKKLTFWQHNYIVTGVMGLLALVPAWVALVSLRAQGMTAGNFLIGAQWLMFVLLLIWGADSGAYFAGKRFGRHKLIPAVSPGKTWEGLFGGIVTNAILAGVGIWLFNIPSEKFGWFLGLVFITTLASVLGDLVESMLKRAEGIKDSGYILPGHGGILDRVDSLIAAVPIFVLGSSYVGLV